MHTKFTYTVKLEKPTQKEIMQWYKRVAVLCVGQDRDQRGVRSDPVVTSKKSLVDSSGADELSLSLTVDVHTL